MSLDPLANRQSHGPAIADYMHKPRIRPQPVEHVNPTHVIRRFVADQRLSPALTVMVEEARHQAGIGERLALRRQQAQFLWGDAKAREFWMRHQPAAQFLGDRALPRLGPRL